MGSNKIPEEFNSEDIHDYCFLHFYESKFLIREIARTFLGLFNCSNFKNRQIDLIQCIYDRHNQAILMLERLIVIQKEMDIVCLVYICLMAC